MTRTKEIIKLLKNDVDSLDQLPMNMTQNSEIGNSIFGDLSQISTCSWSQPTARPPAQSIAFSPLTQQDPLSQSQSQQYTLPNTNFIFSQQPPFSQSLSQLDENMDLPITQEFNSNEIHMHGFHFECIKKGLKQDLS